jgi:hypothetical protein
MLDLGKNAAKRLNYRTCQYGMKWGMWNLQGGGRWFESSIAHLRKHPFAGETPHKRVGRGTLPGSLTATVLQPERGSAYDTVRKVASIASTAEGGGW